MTQKTFQTLVVVLLAVIVAVGGFMAFNYSNKTKDYDPRSDRSQERDKSIVPYGVKGELDTLSLKINDIERTDMISDALSDTTYSKENTSFILVDVSVINTTNNTFTFYPDGILLVDARDVRYNIFQATSGGSIGMERRAIDGRDLGSGIEEKGVIVYEVPKDFKPYALEIEKAQTDSTLVFELE